MTVNNPDKGGIKGWHALLAWIVFAGTAWGCLANQDSLRLFAFVPIGVAFVVAWVMSEAYSHGR